MANISVAMATYNGEAFIAEQLDSLAQQTLLPNELVVCDDGSTDATLSIVDEFERTAPFPVIIVRNPQRLGFTANFFKAARLCRGTLIAFCDQDDIWLPQKLNRTMDFIRESDALLFVHADEWIDRSGTPMGVTYPLDRRYRKNLLWNDFLGHSIVIRRALLDMTATSLTPHNYKEVAGEIDFGHDVLLLEISTAMNKLLFIPEALVRWRVHSEINHAWTKVFKSNTRGSVSFADWMFPHDLAQRYSSAGLSYRRHSKLLACILVDLASSGVDISAASTRLTASMNLLAKRADIMDLRAKFYSEPSLRKRIKLMLEGARIGQYSNTGKGGVRIHNALRDVIACLLH